MGGMSRRKGAVGERELVDELNKRGLLCRRTAQHCGMHGCADVVCDGLNLHIEVKRTERLKLWDAVEQCKRDAKGKPSVIMHRSNGKPWVAIMLLPDWLDDSKAAQSARDLRDALLGSQGNEAL